MNIEKLIEMHGFDVHGGCPGREPSIAVSASNLRAWQAALSQAEQIISRSEIIAVLTATRGLSEGVTADAILAAMRSGK